MANTLYLESYVETTTLLPAELSRLLNTIKVLDERTLELLEAVKRDAEAIIALPARHQANPNDDQTDYQRLMAKLKADDAMLLQLADEKTNLAHRAYDLLNLHSHELDQVLEQFETELAAQVANEYNPFTEYGGGRRGGRFNDTWDSLEPLGAPIMRKAGAHQGVVANKGKRPRDELGGGAGGGPSARAASAVPMPMPAPVPAAAVPAPMAVAQPLAPAAAAMSGGGPEAQDVFTPLPVGPSGEVTLPPTMQFHTTELTAGLQDSAPQPQLPGRLLTLQDIRPELQGRQAEMFWPDDGMWYLIEIHRVNVSDRSATIVYRTGEVEDLNLQEVAQEGHMSLIEPAA